MDKSIKFYYKLGEKIYYNDYTTLINFSKNRKNTLEFVFNFPNLYTQDWTKEPKNNIEYYLDQHTKYLARKYDQIFLAYSGGTDSDTILRSLIRCQIPNVKLFQQQSISTRSTYRIHDGAVAIRRDLKQKYGNILRDLNYSFDTVEFGDFDIKRYQNINSNLDESFNGTHNLDFLTVTSYNHQYQNISWDKLYVKGNKKSCAIIGYEKPKLEINNDFWCWRHVSTIFSNNVNFFEPDCEKIWFYLNDDFPEIQVKLSWLKLKTIEKIIRREKYVYDNESYDWLDKLVKKHSVEIDHSMGYNGLNYFLDIGYAKMGKKAYIGQWLELNHKTNWLKWQKENNFYSTLGNLIDHDLLNEKRLTCHGIKTKPMSICKVADDILNNEHLI